MKMRRRPKKCESTEKAPGPSRTIDDAAKIINNTGNSLTGQPCAKNRMKPATRPPNATAEAANGVTKPTRRSVPHSIAAVGNSQLRSTDLFDIQSTPYTMIVPPSETRSSNSPSPGAPAGNVEKNLCRSCLPPIEFDIHRIAWCKNTFTGESANP